MLLLSKMSFEECRSTWETRENCISPSLKEEEENWSLTCLFILTHSISSNQPKAKAKAKANQDEKRKKQRKWTSSTTIEQIENTIHLTSAWREYEQTTLTQLPAFTALCKCNEYTITSNAHSYPSHHFNTDQDLSHWCFRRLKSIQQSNEWVWRAWQEGVSN